MNWFPISLNIALVITNISIVIVVFQLRGVLKRLRTLEQVEFTRVWIKALEDGESLSDMAYMKEKGFLK